MDIFFSIRAGCTATVEFKQWLHEPFCFVFLLLFGALDLWFLAILFFPPPFCLHLTLYRTLDCLDFLSRGFVPTVIPMWNLYSPHDLTQWKCDVYMYRFLQFFLVCFCFVLFHLSILPSSFPLSSLFSVNLTPSLHWREMGLRLNTIIAISHISLSLEGTCWLFKFQSVTFFTRLFFLASI